MILLKNHKVLFVKTTKTAGTSIELALSQFATAQDIVTPIFPQELGHMPQNYLGFFNPFKELHGAQSFKHTLRPFVDFAIGRKYFNHMTLNQIVSRCDFDLTSYFKFCVERNPYSKVVSYYEMQKTRGKTTKNFSDFIRFNRLPLDHLKYMNRSGEVLLDQVLKYEDLKNSFEKLVCERFNLPNYRFGNFAKVSAARQDFRFYYSDADVDLVNTLYRPVFNIFDYNFE